MISSTEGLAILGNWREGKTILWFQAASESMQDRRRLSLDKWLASELIETSLHPPKMSLSVASSEQESARVLTFDLTDASFSLGPRDERWVRFLEIGLSNKTMVFLVERIPEILEDSER